MTDIDKKYMDEIAGLEEKISILEEERNKWWSKADKPDDIYFTADAMAEKDKKIEELEKGNTNLRHLFWLIGTKRVD